MSNEVETELLPWVEAQIEGIQRSSMVEASRGALNAFKQMKKKLESTRVSTSADIRTQALEEAANVAEEKGGEYEVKGDYGIVQNYVQRVIAANEIAAAIRALIPSIPQPAEPDKCVSCGHTIGVDSEGLCNQRLGYLGDVQPNLCPCRCEFPPSPERVQGVEK